MNYRDRFVIVRGAGDLASGTIHKLVRSGFCVLALEVNNPSAIRRQVSFCECVFEKTVTVDGVVCDYIGNVRKDTLAAISEGMEQSFRLGHAALACDPKGLLIRELKPQAVVDAIIAKKNMGTDKKMAPITIALGPGFYAGRDVDAVIETVRGHDLGRIIYEGCAVKNTGIPGIIGGFGKERVIHAPAEGKVCPLKNIGDLVDKGEKVAVIRDGDCEVFVYSEIKGILRGMIRDGFTVTEGFKIADVDPRTEELKNCFSISDKARCIAGGVLEALLYERGRAYSECQSL